MSYGDEKQNQVELTKIIVKECHDAEKRAN